MLTLHSLKIRRMPYPYATVAAVRGTTLLEVLVTIVIVTFGLLGLAGLQGQLLFAEIESYQRAQAVLLMNDMVERITANRGAASSYVTPGALGVGASAASLALDSCAATAIGVDRDKCEWSNALKGASESKSVSAGGATSRLQTGAMSAARGCIQLIQASDASLGVCAPGIYLVTVAWQGTNKTTAPSATCGQGLYGDDKFRRALSARVSVGLPSCQ